MKSVTSLFDEAVKRNKERGYTILYVAVDAHGTIFKPSKKTQMIWCDGAKEPQEGVFSIGIRQDYEYYPGAHCVLRRMASNPNIKLILWTSTADIAELHNVLASNEIPFDYVNQNPDFQFNRYADFTKKFCFDVLLDDKAGFDPEHDWEELVDYDFRKIGKNDEACESAIEKWNMRNGDIHET